MKTYAAISVLSLAYYSAIPTLAFQVQIETVSSRTRKPLHMAQGFGSGGGFGGSPSKQKKVKKSDVKKTRERILKKYGGDVAQGTQHRIETAMSGLPPYLQMATKLYQQLQNWNTHLSRLTVLQQAQLSEREMEGARRAQEELERLYQEHNFNENDLHNIFQQITWDASADAKAARAITGDMPKDIEERVDRACAIVAEAVKAAGPEGRCLDVGCGFGVLTPSLTKYGVKSSQIYGVDLSPEMIRNAREQHRGVNFESGDFLRTFEDERGFDSIIFCSALHNLSDITGALKKTARLLRPSGSLVIAHPQGASHVLKQSAANSMLVKRGLPTANELRSMDANGLILEVEPAEANSPQESREGYLAVLKRS